MRFLKTIAVIAGVLAAASSCKSQYELLLNSQDVDAKYKAAFEYFNAGKYNKAAALFESMAVFTNGTERDDTVQYFWGLSNYKYKDYYTAETNFKKFLDNYPRSSFASDAMYMRIDCLFRQTLRWELDQSPTYRALQEISQFQLEHPDSEHYEKCTEMSKQLNDRLDKKAYEAARLYYKMEDYKASRVALRNVIKDDAENIYREHILYHIAMSSYKYANLSVRDKQKERYLVFIDDYLNFIGEYPESNYRRELEHFYRRAQKAVGRQVSIDDDNLKEKDFAKERAKIEKAAKKAAKAAAKAKKAAEKAEKKAAEKNI